MQNVGTAILTYSSSLPLTVCETESQAERTHFTTCKGDWKWGKDVPVLGYHAKKTYSYEAAGVLFLTICQRMMVEIPNIQENK
jgi:hypothetical protein